MAASIHLSYGCFFFFLLLGSVDLKSNFTQWSRISHSFVYEECRFCFLILFCFYGSEFPWYAYLAFQLSIRLGRGATEQCDSNFPFPECDSALKNSKGGGRTGLIPSPSHACPYLARLRTINMDLVLGWPCLFADGYVRTHEGTVSPTPTGRGLGGDSFLLLAWLTLGLLGGSGGGDNCRKLGWLNLWWGLSHPRLAYLGSRVSSRGPVNSMVTPYMSSLVGCNQCPFLTGRYK